VRFFFDNCISHRIAAGLHALATVDGDEVVHLTARFPRDIRDEEWLPRLGAEGEWVVLSGDFNIFNNPQRRKIWRRCRLTTFFLQRAWSGGQYWDQAWRLFYWWPRIGQLVSIVEEGGGYSVPSPSTRRSSRFDSSRAAVVAAWTGRRRWRSSSPPSR
jgi:hypothetical protein